MAQSVDASPVQHPMQAVARALQGLYGGYLQGQASREEKENEQRAMADLMAVYGGQSQPQSQPAAPQTTAPIQPQPSGQPSDPRGIRNNNPLNIEAGRFTQSQPGYAGSDGRFARFANADQGMAAADSLLNVYGQKHGLNTITGIVSRWAPAGDGNNVGNYAGFVAKRLGVAPDQPLDMNKPEVRQAIAGAMAEFENGRPVRMAQAGPPQVPQSSPQMPPAAGGMPPNMAQLMRAASNPWLGRTGQVLAGEIVKKQFTPRDQWVDERGPDGSFYQRNTVTGERKVIEKSPILPQAAVDQKAAIARAGKPETNVVVEKEGRELLVKEAVKGMAAANTAATDATKRIAAYGQMAEAMKAFTPGASAELRLGAMRWLKESGIVKGENVADGEALKAIGRRLELAATPRGQGQITENERTLIRETVPKITNSPEGMVKIIGMLDRLDKYDIAVARIYRENAKKNNGVPNYVEISEELAALGPPMTDDERIALESVRGEGASNQGQPAQPAATDPLEGRTIFNPQTGETRIRRNGQWVPMQ